MENLENIIEAILFVSGDGVEISDVAEKLQIDEKEVQTAVDKLKAKREKTGIQLITYRNKVQLSSNPEYTPFVDEVLRPIKEKQLTKAVMETAAIIAYKQPITRLEIENVRGVNSDYAVNCLSENNLIEVVGRKDAIGKPLLYGTTDNFLKKFGLQNIAELPDYDELLERIRVIETPKEKSLMHFEDYAETQANEAQAQEETLEEKQETLEDIVSETEDGDIEFSQDYIKSLFSKGKKGTPVDAPKDEEQEEVAAKNFMNTIYDADDKDDDII